jgi:hypothetical protein
MFPRVDAGGRKQGRNRFGLVVFRMQHAPLACVAAGMES